MTVVLDAWAVMCMLRDEPSGRRVHRLLQRQRPIMSWVNLTEVAYLVQRAIGEEAAEQTVRDLLDHVDVENAGRDRSLAAATLKAEFRLSLGDAYAAATALAHDATLWTGDPDLLRLNAIWKHEDLRSQS